MTVTLADFPAAPARAYVSREGWLIVDDEAWTVQEWADSRWKRPGGRPVGRPRKYESDDERREAKLRYDREYHRQRRVRAVA